MTWRVEVYVEGKHDLCIDNIINTIDLSPVNS